MKIYDYTKYDTPASGSIAKKIGGNAEGDLNFVKSDDFSVDKHIKEEVLISYEEKAEDKQSDREDNNKDL